MQDPFIKALVTFALITVPAYMAWIAVSLSVIASK